jgi:hypothetical protein
VTFKNGSTAPFAGMTDRGQLKRSGPLMSGPYLSPRRAPRNVPLESFPGDIITLFGYSH